MKLLILFLVSFSVHAQFRAEIDNIGHAGQRLEAQTLDELGELVEKFKTHPSKDSFRWERDGDQIRGYRLLPIEVEEQEEELQLGTVRKKPEEKLAVVITIKDISAEVTAQKQRLQARQAKLESAREATKGIEAWLSGERDLSQKEASDLLRLIYLRLGMDE